MVAEASTMIWWLLLHTAGMLGFLYLAVRS